MLLILGLRDGPVRVLVHVSASPDWLPLGRSVEKAQLPRDELVGHLCRGLVVVVVVLRLADRDDRACCHRACQRRLSD